MKDYRHSNDNALFKVWAGMHRRCYSQSSKDFKHYGGRGIRVSKRWHDFRNFVDDMSTSYKKGLTIERTNVDGDYSPANCKWATKREQFNNRRSNHKLRNPLTGEVKTITQWAEEFGISRNTITSRIRLGYTKFDELVAKSLPRWNAEMITNPETGEAKSVSQWAAEFGIHKDTALYRLRAGITDFKTIFSTDDLRSSDHFAEESREVVD